MKTYILTIEWRDEVFTFECQADDSDHAREQVENAYPRCQILKTEVK